MYGALAVALALGFTTGAGMLMIPIFGPPDGVTWRTHTQAHGVAQTLGWAGLFVMGVAYHVVPRFRNFAMPVVWPQYVSLLLILIGVMLRFLGQAFHTLAVSDWLIWTSAVLLVLGAVLFVAIHRCIECGSGNVSCHGANGHRALRMGRLGCLQAFSQRGLQD